MGHPRGSGLVEELRREHRDIERVLERAPGPRYRQPPAAERRASAAMKFFDRYTQNSSGIEFARSFGRLAAELGRRIQREEALLYPALERLAG